MALPVAKLLCVDLQGAISVFPAVATRDNQALTKAIHPDRGPASNQGEHFTRRIVDIAEICNLFARAGMLLINQNLLLHNIGELVRAAGKDDLIIGVELIEITKYFTVACHVATQDDVVGLTGVGRSEVMPHRILGNLPDQNRLPVGIGRAIPIDFYHWAIEFDNRNCNVSDGLTPHRVVALEHRCADFGTGDETRGSILVF